MRTAVALILLTIVLAGCTRIVTKAGDSMAQNLGRAVLNQDDPATVRDGLPAYLLLLDGLLESSPDNAALLSTSAQMYASYAGSFVHEPVRAKRLSNRALTRAWRAVCIEPKTLCSMKDAGFDEFAQLLQKLDVSESAAAYALASSWSTYIQSHRDDWVSIADIPKVSGLLERVIELSPDSADGMPWVYLGVLNSLRPAAVGGEPEKGRANFEQAIALSHGDNLMAKTLFAEFYARLVFDQELHDQLLNDVLQADPHVPGLTLSNVLAQDRARELLAGSSDYF